MANYMKDVANILGVELYEEFECSDGYKYKLTESGVYTVDHGIGRQDVRVDHVLHYLLCGKATIEPKPWVPKLDEIFWVVRSDGYVTHKYWEDCTNHLNYYRLGNCYQTQEEAEANCKKWIAFYKGESV